MKVYQFIRPDGSTYQITQLPRHGERGDQDASPITYTIPDAVDEVIEGILRECHSVPEFFELTSQQTAMQKKPPRVCCPNCHKLFQLTQHHMRGG